MLQIKFICEGVNFMTLHWCLEMSLKPAVSNADTCHCKDKGNSCIWT